MVAWAEGANRARTARSKVVAVGYSAEVEAGGSSAAFSKPA